MINLKLCLNKLGCNNASHSIRPFLLLAIILFSSGCTTTSLKYHFDPEITQLEQLSAHAKVVAITVEDKRSAQTTSKDENIQHIPHNPDDAKTLKNKLIANMKQNNFKIIGNALLADLSFNLQIEQFDVSVNKSFFKSEVMVKSQLRVIARHQGNKYEKIYTMKRQQEVANPATELDVTGVVNQLLSQQLSIILSDKSLLEIFDNSTQDY